MNRFYVRPCTPRSTCRNVLWRMVATSVSARTVSDVLVLGAFVLDALVFDILVSEARVSDAMVSDARVSDARVTWHRLGRKRRLVLLLAWDTLLPATGPVPVNSQRRDMASTLIFVKTDASVRQGLTAQERANYRRRQPPSRRKRQVAHHALQQECLPQASAAFILQTAVGAFHSSPDHAGIQYVTATLSLVYCRLRCSSVQRRGR